MHRVVLSKKRNGTKKQFTIAFTGPVTGDVGSLLSLICRHFWLLYFCFELAAYPLLPALYIFRLWTAHATQLQNVTPLSHPVHLAGSLLSGRCQFSSITTFAAGSYGTVPPWTSYRNLILNKICREITSKLYAEY